MLNYIQLSVLCYTVAGNKTTVTCSKDTTDTPFSIKCHNAFANESHIIYSCFIRVILAPNSFTCPAQSTGYYLQSPGIRVLGKLLSILWIYLDIKLDDRGSSFVPQCIDVQLACTRRRPFPPQCQHLSYSLLRETRLAPPLHVFMKAEVIQTSV